MKIHDLAKRNKPLLSFEVFPPKKDDAFEMIDTVLEKLAGLKPDFISVTCGAGGTGQRSKTADITNRIKDKFGISSVAHLTCYGTVLNEIIAVMDQFKSLGIENILALRGDIPENSQRKDREYIYVKDMIRDIRGNGFSIGAAAYPEGHIDCESMEDNIEHLYQKQEAGANWFITQLFFDNTVFYRFYELALKRGIHLPVLPGIMPLLSRSQVEKMIFMCAASLPSGVIKLLNKYKDCPEDLRKAGVEYASKQILDLLAHGVDGIHFYAMNKPEVAAMMLENIREYR